MDTTSSSRTARVSSDRPRGRWGLLAAGVAFALVLTGCTSSHHPSAAKTSPAPTDPSAVTVVAGKATTLDLGGGADLIIPPGAMTPGATVSATYRGRPAGSAPSMTPGSDPVELISSPPDAIHGLLRLEFPVPASSLAAGTDPATEFGISTYDATTKTWAPFASTYDSARHMVIAQIPHFSWWNPFTWDFDQIWADVAQGFGSLVGTRSGPARCSGPVPSWVNQIAGLSNDADVAIHGCTQEQGNILDVELQNNRPYGQVLTYGAGVKWGWHEKGSSGVDIARNAFMDHMMGSNQVYIPPLGSASVGIFQGADGSNTDWHIGPTQGSIGTDLFSYLAGAAAAVVLPTAVACATQALSTPLTDLSIGSLRSYLLDIGGCAEASFLASVTAGEKDTVPVQQLAGELDNIKRANIVGAAVLVGGATWRIGDLVADWIVSHGTLLGNGFSVLTKAAQPPPVTGPTTTAPGPGPTQQAPTQPTTHAPTPPPTTQAPPAPTPQPVNAYDNYGPANAGHAMCRGNPGNSLSLPGGTTSQTFTVPGGVASLSGALVQIDPDASVTANLSVAVNGNVEATASTAAAGDTRFSFGPIGVSAGQTITLSITFTASSGKIITVYTAGSPGGTFIASNSCPDGAPNVSTSSTGLRAVVSGTS